MERTANSGSPFFLKEYPGYARNGIKRFFVSDWQIWVSFLIPCFTLLISYFIFGVFPFGKESVLSLDLNGQYVYYYDYMYDVFAGKESIFYSWSRNLSGEFMGIVGYYLASPFNLLVWIFPRECITEGLLTMMVTKVGAIGLCMAVSQPRQGNEPPYDDHLLCLLRPVCIHSGADHEPYVAGRRDDTADSGLRS